MAIALIILYAFYPFVSMLLGERFPKIVTYIMPCPITTISIAIYSCYKKKNILFSRMEHGIMKQIYMQDRFHPNENEGFLSNLYWYCPFGCSDAAEDDF